MNARVSLRQTDRFDHPKLHQETSHDLVSSSSATRTTPTGVIPETEDRTKSAFSPSPRSFCLFSLLFLPLLPFWLLLTARHNQITRTCCFLLPRTTRQTICQPSLCEKKKRNHETEKRHQQSSQLSNKTGNRQGEGTKKRAAVHFRTFVNRYFHHHPSSLMLFSCTKPPKTTSPTTAQPGPNPNRSIQKAKTPQNNDDNSHPPFSVFHRSQTDEQETKSQPTDHRIHDHHYTRARTQTQRDPTSRGFAPAASPSPANGDLARYTALTRPDAARSCGEDVEADRPALAPSHGKPQAHPLFPVQHREEREYERGGN